MKIKFRAPNDESIVEYDFVQTVQIVTLLGDSRPVDAWLLQLSRPQLDGSYRVFVPTSYRLFVADEGLPFDSAPDRDDIEDSESEESIGNLPEDFYHCHRVMFIIVSDRDNIKAAQEFLNDSAVPYACGIHDTFMGPHAHFLVDWYYFNRYSRVNLRSQLEGFYQASGFHKSLYLAADLSYIRDGCSDESDFINHLNKKEN